MKKLLSFIGTIGLISSMSTTVAACKGEKKDSIAIVLSTTANPYFSKMKQVAEEYEKELDYKFNFYDSEDQPSKETQNIEDALTKLPKGVIVNPVNAENNSGGKKIIAEELPLVTVDREYVEKVGAASFVTDNSKEANDLFQEGIKLFGEQEKFKVHVLRGQSGADASTKRYEGFITKNIEKIEITANSDKNDLNWERGKAKVDVTDKFETHIEDADIIFAENDEMAMGALAALNEGTDAMKKWFAKGIIIGFDGNVDAKESIEKWTKTSRNHLYLTVEQNPTKMIKDAINKTIKLIESGEKAPTSYEKYTPVDATLIKPKGN